MKKILIFFLFSTCACFAQPAPFVRATSTNNTVILTPSSGQGVVDFEVNVTNSGGITNGQTGLTLGGNFQNVFKPNMYGAIGYPTDDSTPFSNMVAAANLVSNSVIDGGGKAYLANGPFVMTNLGMSWQNMSLSNSTYVAGEIRIGNDMQRIQNIALLGPGTNYWTNNYSTNATNADGISWSFGVTINPQNTTISQCFVAGFWNGIYVNSSNDINSPVEVIINNCQIVSCAGADLSLTGGWHYLVTDCTLGDSDGSMYGLSTNSYPAGVGTPFSTTNGLGVYTHSVAGFISIFGGNCQYCGAFGSFNSNAVYISDVNIEAFVNPSLPSVLLNNCYGKIRQGISSIFGTNGVQQVGFLVTNTVADPLVFDPPTSGWGSGCTNDPIQVWTTGSSASPIITPGWWVNVSAANGVQKICHLFIPGNGTNWIGTTTVNANNQAGIGVPNVITGSLNDAYGGYNGAGEPFLIIGGTKGSNGFIANTTKWGDLEGVGYDNTTYDLLNWQGVNGFPQLNFGGGDNQAAPAYFQFYLSTGSPWTAVQQATWTASSLAFNVATAINSDGGTFTGNGSGVTNTFNSTTNAAIVGTTSGVTNTSQKYGTAIVVSTAGTYSNFDSGGNFLYTNSSVAGQEEWPVAPGAGVQSITSGITSCRIIFQ